MQNAYRLKNGDTVINNWVNEWTKNGDNAPGSEQAIEVTPDKKVVWALREWGADGGVNLGPATSIQFLDQGDGPSGGCSLRRYPVGSGSRRQVAGGELGDVEELGRGGVGVMAVRASRNMVLQKGQAVATVCAPVAASSRARTWLTRASPFSSPRKASPPPAPQQKLRSWLRGASTRVRLLLDDGAGLVVDVLVAAEVAGVVVRRRSWWLLLMQV